MARKKIAYIGVGSNLCNPRIQVKSAFKSLSKHASISQCTSSSWYQSIAIGPAGQPDYVNGAFRVETAFSPIDLLDMLLELENRHKRIRIQKWGPRTLDLDLLLYEDQTINHPRLKVPHPELENRPFVLKPLFELNPNLKLPSGRKVRSLLTYQETQKLVKLPLRR